MASEIASYIVAPLAAGVLALSLVGCVSIEKSGDSDPSPSASQSPSSPENSGSLEGSVSPRDKNPEGTASGTPNVPKETAQGSFQSTFDLIAAKATVLQCTGATSVTENGSVLKLVGDCSHVEVSGAGNMIVGGHIKNLSITGQGNVVAVNNIETGSVTGLGNAVSWRNDNAKIDDSGQGNKLGADAFNGIDLDF